MRRPDEGFHMVIVGAGPAGLSAAINAESERLDTVVLDGRDRLGGQAGTSSLIENLPGFPDGITGEDLTARMIAQALKFQTEFRAPVQVESITTAEEGIIVSDDTENFLGRTALVCCGVEYRRLNARNLAAYLGRGVHYGTPNIRAVYEDKKIFVVGGANSAGQTAMHLSKFTGCKVHMLVRGESIEDKMSGYLVDRVAANSNIQVHTQTEVVGVDGDGHLRKVIFETDGVEQEMPADELFVLIGATPKTNWLPDRVARDADGFIKAGSDIPADVRAEFVDLTGRQPFGHETSVPGLFVAGDVRCGTTKRVAGAVGDGAIVVPEVHRYLSIKREAKV